MYSHSPLDSGGSPVFQVTSIFFPSIQVPLPLPPRLVVRPPPPEKDNWKFKGSSRTLVG